MSLSNRRYFFSNLAIALGFLLIVSAIWIAVQERLEAERKHHLEQAQSKNTMVALGLELYTRNLMDAMDRSLQRVRHEYVHHGRRADLDYLLQDGRVDAGPIHSIALLDEQGRRVGGTRGSEAPDNAGQEIIEPLRAARDDPLLIGGPRVRLPAHAWEIDIARRLDNEDGSFAGAVVVSADPTALAAFYRKAELGDRHVILLVNTEGIVLLRMAGGNIRVGEDMSRSGLMRAYRQDAQAGHFRTRGSRDGIVRLMSYRTVGDLPLVVAAGSALGDELSEADTADLYLFAGIATFTLLLLAGVLMRNVSRQRALVRDLARDEARFHATFDQAFVGMAQSRPDGQPLQVNRTLCEMLGRTEGDVLARPLEDFVHPDDRRAGPPAPAAGAVERRLVRRDGGVVWASMATTAVRNEAGAVEYLVTVVQDISEFKRIDQMKNEFVSVVSHELRTPLTSIRGSLGLLTGGVAGTIPEAARKLLDIARNNCERLIRLINDMLDIEKIESGKMRFELQPASLQSVAERAIAANQGLARQAGVRFELQAPHEPLLVTIDPDRLEQVFTNLLSNAAKYAPPDSAVHVRLTRRDACVRAEVEDHGPGIPDEFRARIFQKFSQADSSDSRQKSGSGLGLNISKAIVERLGGTIGFTTKPGAGSTFHFELPEARPAPQPLAVAPSRGGATASPRPRVLVCEDDRDIARVVAMMLDNAGFDCDIAYTAGQARDHLEMRQYHAMTLDLRLPDADGIALIRELRTAKRTARLPIVVLSVAADEGRVRINGEARTVSDWLAKPIDESRLVRAVQRAVDGGPDGRPCVLHVDEDVDVQCLSAAIAQDFATLEFAGTLREARELLGRKRFDVVVMELDLRDGPARELLDDIAAQDAPPAVLIFSLDVPAAADRARVHAVLPKVKTSNQALREAIRGAILSRNAAPMVTQ